MIFLIFHLIHALDGFFIDEPGNCDLEMYFLALGKLNAQMETCPTDQPGYWKTRQKEKEISL